MDKMENNLLSELPKDSPWYRLMIIRQNEKKDFLLPLIEKRLEVLFENHYEWEKALLKRRPKINHFRRTRLDHEQNKEAWEEIMILTEYKSPYESLLEPKGREELFKKVQKYLSRDEKI